MRLAVTRSGERLTLLSAKAVGMGIEVVPLPLTLTKPILFNWPEGLSHDQVDWVFFSSANGVRSFFSRLDELGLTLPEYTKHASVGGRSSRALKASGREVRFQPTQSGGEALFTQFLNSRPGSNLVLVYARGRVVNFDPAALLSTSDVQYYPVVCYENVANKVDPQIVAPLADSDYILFTAPSAVDAFQVQFGPPVPTPIAIGPTTAAAMGRLGWTNVKIMKQPDVDRVLEYL